MKNKKMVIGGLILIGIIGIVIWLVADREKKADLVTVKRGAITQTVNDTGYVQIEDKISLQAFISGRINRLLIKQGERVHSGQLLLEMENSDLVSSIKASEAEIGRLEWRVQEINKSIRRFESDLDLATIRFERAKVLAIDGAGPREDVEIYRNARITAESAIEQLRAELDGVLLSLASLQAARQEKVSEHGKLEVLSPVSGIVAELPVRHGNVVVPGGSLLTIVPEKSVFEVRADILSDDIAAVAVGQPARITAPFFVNGETNGRVTNIYPEAVESRSPLGVNQRRVAVIIAFNADAKAILGGEVRVSIQTLSRNDILVIPRTALFSGKDGEKAVYLITNKKAVIRSVATGVKDRDNIEIISGLAAGDVVALHPEEITAGDRVITK